MMKKRIEYRWTRKRRRGTNSCVESCSKEKKKEKDEEEKEKDEKENVLL